MPATLPLERSFAEPATSLTNSSCRSVRLRNLRADGKPPLAQGPRRSYHGTGVPLGAEGFLVTCLGGKEHASAQEIANVLDEFYERLAEAPGAGAVARQQACVGVGAGGGVDDGGEEEEEEDQEEGADDCDGRNEEEAQQPRDGRETREAAPVDIATALESEMQGLRSLKQVRFARVETGCKGLVFVRMRRSPDRAGPGPSELAEAVARHTAETRVSKTRYSMRLMPAEATCYASPAEIAQAARPVIARHFPTGDSDKQQKFAVVYEARANDDVDRMAIIKEVASVVPKPHTVDLSNPDKTILIQVVKTSCTIGVVADFKGLGKYNLKQLTEPPDNKQQVKDGKGATATEASCQPARDTSAAAQDHQGQPDLNGVTDAQLADNAAGDAKEAGGNNNAPTALSTGLSSPNIQSSLKDAEAMKQTPLDETVSQQSDAQATFERKLTAWNVLSDARMEPPIQTLYLRSGGATTLIFMLLGASAVISLLMRSAMPGNMVILPDVHVTLHDGVVGCFVDTGGLHANESRVEQNLRAAEALSTDADDLAIRELIALLDRRAGRGGQNLLIKVQSHIGQLLLHVTHDFALSGGGEGVASLCQDLHQAVGEVTPSQVQAQDGVRQSVPLIDRNSVCYTISRVQHNTCNATWSTRRLREEHSVLLRRDAELIVEGVVPDLLHVVPVVRTVLDGILEREDAALRLSLVADVRILLAHANHDALVAGPADNAGEDGPRGIVAGETGLHGERHRERAVAPAAGGEAGGARGGSAAP
eukprot:SM000015S01146  [mRNA]  locus=s15:20962:27044:+ [translate_table: standard]